MNSQRQKGLAMVIVIWVLSLLTIMAGSFALTMRRETVVISAVKDNAMAFAAAEAGINIAKRMMIHEDKEKRWQANGRVYKVKYQEAEISIRILSELGKIDINLANQDLLSALMFSTSLDSAAQQNIVSAIMDWRDRDDIIRINGAEKEQYQAAGLSYIPANKYFQMIEELQMVLGMDAVTFEQLKPLITIYSGQGNVDEKVASKAMMAILSNPDFVKNDDSQLFDSGDDLGGDTIQSDDAEVQQEIFEENQPFNNEKDVYTLTSQARFFGEVDVGIKTVINNIVSSNQIKPFQTLDYQQIYQDDSLFSGDVE